MYDVLDLRVPADLREALAFDNSYLETVVEPLNQQAVAAWPAAAAAFAARTGRQPETFDEIRRTIETVPAYRQAWAQYQRAVDQRWRDLEAATAANHDRIEAQLTAVPNEGVGSLHLDPALAMPTYYTDHVIHLAPGSFYGNHIYALMTDLPTGPFTLRKDTAWASAERDVARIPGDDYRSIVDLGCGLGRFTLPLKARFPQAAVSGIDLAAVELRYGHWIAEQRGLAIDFRQEDLRHTSLATGSADLVVMTAVQHELPQPAMRETIAEAHRLLRPGGRFLNIDIIPNRHMPPFTRFWYGRHVETGSEPFWRDAADLDLAAELATAGFHDVTERGPSVPIGPTGPNGPWWTLATR